jgi:hypothetical protein
MTLFGRSDNSRKFRNFKKLNVCVGKILGLLSIKYEYTTAAVKTMHLPLFSTLLFISPLLDDANMLYSPGPITFEFSRARSR